MSFLHAPVMIEEVVEALAPQDHGVYVDATLGAGGYTRAILAEAACRVVAFARDPTAIERARPWAEAYEGRLTLVGRPFGEMEAALDDLGLATVDGVVFDFGVSSMQLDEAERGFSFMRDGPLSMRMDAQGEKTAADVVNTAETDDLAEIFRALGEEKRAGAAARAIVAAREKAPIARTGELADILERALGRKPGDKIHPATRVFQALRIFVNDELGEIVRGLAAAEARLSPAGHLAAVTFHSLEDRIVKRFLHDRAGRIPGASRHAPAVAAPEETFHLLHAKAVTPSAAEIEENPRARSAKLRAAVRLDAPPRGLDPDPPGAPRLRLSSTLADWS